MSRNFIITCGTSQIEKQEKFDKIANELPRDMRRLYEAKKNIDKLKGSDINDGYFQEALENEDCQTLVDLLSKLWEGFDDFIGRPDNPFGAEISTLFLMNKKFAKQGQPLDGDRDLAVLLYSQTRRGAFCAAVVYRLLREKMKFGTVTPKLLKHVTEDPEQYERALKYVAHCAADSYESGYDNVYVVTGGYKYITDIVGLVAQLAKLPRYYLFEFAEDVYNLTFDESLLPHPDALLEKLIAFKKCDIGPQDVPLVFRHPESDRLNAFGEVLIERLKSPYKIEPPAVHRS